MTLNRNRSRVREYRVPRARRQRSEQHAERPKRKTHSRELGYMNLYKMNPFSRYIILVVLTATSAFANQTIILSDDGVESLRIQTVETQPGDFRETLFAIGRIEPIPARKSFLSSRIEGRITAIEAFEGDHVTAGQSLVEIESRQPGNPPPRVELHAPMDGMVMRSHTHLGKPISPENELFEIIDLSKVYAVARMPEAQAGQIPLGTQAHIRIAAAPEQDFAGALIRYGSEANPQNGTLDAYFILENPEYKLRPNMRAEFSIAIETKRNVMSVPKSSIQNDGVNQFVFVRDFDLPNAFVKAPVTTGSRNEELVEITGGLFPGDEVVTQGSYALMFAGGNSISLKEALDAAHGHEHNEDGSEMTPEQRRQREAQRQAAQGGGSNSSTVWFLSILSGLLFVLLLLSLFKPRRA